MIQPRFSVIPGARRIPFLLLLCAALFALPRGARAQTFWESTGGPGSFSMAALFARSSGLVVASTQQGFAFHSTDDGATWTSVTGGLPNVNAFATNGGASVYAATIAGQYYSTDDGISWAQNSSTQIFGWNTLDITVGGNGTLFCVPQNPSAPTGAGGVFESTDDGITWFRGNYPTLANLRVVSYNAKAGSLFAGTQDTSMWRSPDNGASWVRKNNGFPFVQFRRIASDPLTGYVYCATNNGLFRSTNNGDLWTKLTSLPVANVAALLVSHLGHVYVADGSPGNAAVLRSTDDGNTWQQLVTGLSGDRITCFAESDEGMLFAGGTSGTVYRSRRPIDAVFFQSTSALAFGNVGVNTTATRDVSIRNTGQGTLVIDAVTSSDPAFTVQPAVPLSLLANEVRVFTVAFSPSLAQSYAASILFTHNGLSNPDTVQVSGSGARADFSVSPLSLDFLSVKLGTSSTRQVSVQNTGVDTLRIQSVIPSDAQVLAASPQGPLFVAPGDKQVFDITFTPREAKVYDLTLAFTHNGLTSPNIVRAAGEGIAPAFSVSGTGLDFFDVLVGESSTLPVTVINNGKDTLEIFSASTNEPLVFTVAGPVAASIPPGDSRSYDITFSPAAVKSYAASLEFTHNAPGSPGRLPLFGRGTLGDLEIIPRLLAFGPVVKGGRKQLPVTLHNNGTAPINVVSVTPQDTVYTTNFPGFARIQPDSSLVVLVTFSPPDAMAYEATVQVEFDGIGSPMSFNVSGGGVEGGLQFDPSPLDAGSSRLNVPRVANVKARNIGIDTVVIAGVTSSSARFSALPAGKVTLAPGAEQSYTVTFTPVDTGLVTGVLTFAHSGPNAPGLLDVRGRGLPDPVRTLRVTPKQLSFGDVPIGSPVQRTVDLTATGTDTVRITGAISTLAAYAPEQSSLVVPTGATRQLRVTFTCDSAGTRRGYLILTHNAQSSPDTVVLVALGIANTMPAFQLSERRVDFGNVLVGARDTVRVLLSNPGAASLSVLSVSVNGADFATDATPGTIAPAGTVGFDVVFAPRQSGIATGFVRFSHNASTSPDTVFLAGNGTVSAEPRWASSVAAIDFGDVPVSTTRDSSFVISNAGNATLRFTNIASDNPRFRILSRPDSIPAGQSAPVAVRFAPDTSTSLQSGDIRFEHNAQPSSNTVQLSGRGMAAGLTVTMNRSSVDFGSVRVGGGAEEIVRLTNTGAVNVVLSSVTVNEQAFSVEPQEGTIPGFGSLDLHIRFDPLEARAFAGTAELNFGSAGSRQLPLAGLGVASATVELATSAATAGAAITVSITSQGGFQASSATLSYRRTGEAQFARSPFDFSATPFSAVIPADFLTLRGIEYFVTLRNAQGDSITSPPDNPEGRPNVIRVAVPRFPSPLALQRETYRMISVPADLADTDFRSVLADDFGAYNVRHWRLFRWDNGAYKEAAAIGKPVTPGTAFWLITHAALPFDIDTALSVSSAAPASIALDSGWNQLANPYAFPVAWSAVRADGPGFTDVPVLSLPDTVSMPYYFDGGAYVPRITWLRPWEGFFVYSALPGVTLRLPAVEDLVGPVTQLYKTPNAPGGYAMDFAAREQGSGLTDAASLRVSSSDEEVDARLNALKPPPPGDHVSLGFRDGDALLGEVRVSTNEDGIARDLVLSTSLDNAITDIDVRERGARPDGWNLYIVDAQTGALLGKNVSRFGMSASASSSKRVTVLLGSEQFARARNGGREYLPSGIALESAFPNPFRSATLLRYTLGEERGVELTVSDRLGRRVCLLASASQQSGRYAIEWDGRDDAGRALPAGVYYATLRAGDLLATTKLLLLQ